MDVSETHDAPNITMPTSIAYAGYVHESSKLHMLAESGYGGGGGNAERNANGNGKLSGSNETMRLISQDGESKAVRYRECLKNHAASMGGHAVDGCGEFMPNGEEGSLEALKCAVCKCHRNFHRQEAEGEAPCYCRRLPSIALPSSSPLALPCTSDGLRPRVPSHHQMIMALGQTDSEDLETRFPHAFQVAIPARKRFRTKFTAEQKIKMCGFAEKLGWRIQKQDEREVQEFCTDAGVKRHVLKVWMHNNKHTMGKKL